MSRYLNAARKTLQATRVGALKNRVAVSIPQYRPAAAATYRTYSSSIPAFGSGAAAEPFLDVKIVTDRVIEVLKNFEKVDVSKVSPQSKFKDDLDLDSLDAVEVVMAIEEEFCIEIPDAEADKILSIPDAVAYISGHPMAK